MSTYTVIRWDSSKDTASVTVEAHNHRDAIRKSGLMAPGARAGKDVDPLQMHQGWKTAYPGQLHRLTAFGRFFFPPQPLGGTGPFDPETAKTLNAAVLRSAAHGGADLILRDRPQAHVCPGNGLKY